MELQRVLSKLRKTFPEIETPSDSAGANAFDSLVERTRLYVDNVRRPPAG
jgi:hypothetical protein